jgi:1-acyl-sn-glycerol-3-phosphate acyltransferase
MPTTKGKVEKWSLAYYILKQWVDLGFRFYFSTTVSGLKSLPKNKTLIFAPNHQNALMDALAILTVKTWQPVFLARADIFKKPLLSKMLTFLKIMPVYRMRDGYENLQRNDEIFNKTIDVLRNQNGLVILPEGNHGDLKRLRPLKKGIARIALQALDADSSLDIMIVPVGLDYDHYSRVGSKLHVRFGEAFSVKPFLNVYMENPAKAYNMLISHLEKGIKAEMIDIEEEKYYSVYEVLINSFANEIVEERGLPKNHSTVVDMQQDIIKGINHLRDHSNDDFLLLAADALEYRLLLSRRGITPGFFPLGLLHKVGLFPLALALLVTLPLFVASFINIIVPVAVAKLVSNKFEDKQFISSVRFVIGLVLSLLMLIIQTIAFALFTTSLLYSAIYIVGFIASFYIFFVWKRWARIFGQRVNIIGHGLKGSNRMNRLAELHASLHSQLMVILNNS